MAGGTVGALRIVLGANTANFEAGMKRASRQAQTSATSIQRSLGGIKGAFGGLTAGLIGGAALSGLVSLTKKSLEYASSLGETAQQLGVTSEALQVYRYAASQVGISNEEMDKSLAKLTRTAGEAAEGAKSQAEAFNKLGVNVLDVNGKVKDTDRLMREVADGLSKIEDPARRAAIEVDLLGRAGQKLDTLLAGGSKAIDELRNAAHRLGVVLSEEQIQRADETADKLSALKQVLEARIAGAVSDNAAAIYDFANSLATLVSEIIGVISWLKKLDAALPQIRVDKRDISVRAGTGFANQEVFGTGKQGVSVTTGLGPIQPFRAASATGLNRIAGGGGRKGSGRSAESIAAEAERKRQEALRDAADIERAIADAKADELRAQKDLLTDYVERGTIEKQLIDHEIDQQNASLALAVKLGDMDSVTAEQLKASNERLRVLRKLEVVQQTELDRQQDFARLEDVDFDIKSQMLEQQSQLAETQAERRRVELQILDLAYKEQQAAIDRLAASLDWADQEEARRRQVALNGNRARDTELVMRGTRGPLEDFQASLPTTAAKMNEALQSVAVDGLRALEDGIISVIDGTKSLGEAFRDMASQIIADLLRIQIQRAILGPLSNLLGGAMGLGGAASAGLNFGGTSVTSMMALNPGVFASGGYTGNMPAGKIAGLVHGREYVFDADATRRIGVGNLEAIRKGIARPANDRGRAGDVYHLGGININAPMTARIARETGSQAASAFQRRIAMTKKSGM